jgi:uncharacterized membrane protein YqjE
MIWANAADPKEPILTASPSQGPKPTPRPPRAADQAEPATSLRKAPATAAAEPATAGRGKHAAAEPNQPSVGQLVSEASTALSNLIHSEIELAKLELRSTVKNGFTGIGLFAAAAVVLVFSLTFGFFALAEGIAAAGLDRWLAFLIVFGLQLSAVVLAVVIGIRKVKRLKAPERTLRTTRETIDYLKKSRG